MAYIYRYDWMITPFINKGLNVVPSDDEKLTDQEKNKVLKGFFKILKRFDDFNVKKFCGDVALKVIKNGCYYCYIKPSTNNKISIQELPVDYCRSRFSINERPVVEFNMAYFDDAYPSVEQRVKILNLFPDEFKKGYRAYKEGKLRDPADLLGGTGWYTLDPECTAKFNMNGEDFPPFIAAIPALIDLDKTKEVDQRRIVQKLLRLIIQKLPLDKNGEMIFDPDEARELHTNAVSMLGQDPNFKVLTTFAEVGVQDMSDKGNVNQNDDIDRTKNTAFDEFGTSINLFNSTSNNALKYSMLNDASNMYNLLQQFEDFLNQLLAPYNKLPDKCYYRAELLQTTNENYQEMSKLYRNQTQSGFSKMLPQIALGQSQSSILATAYWENSILDLIQVFVPPITSATMNADTLGALTNKDAGAASKTNKNSEEEKGAGRPELKEEEKSEKTIANRESL